MIADESTQGRRTVIRELIRGERIGSQEELRKRLAARGFDVTQATLSRDLARINARRVTLREGGSVYELADSPLSSVPDELSLFREMIVAVLQGDSLVVVQTRTGAASAVAIAIDGARIPEVLGTLAGDDTIFVAPKRGVSTGKLKQRLESAWHLSQSGKRGANGSTG